MRFIFTYLVLLIALSFSQTNSKALKVVEHKNSWKAYRSGIEIPKSHFFRIVNDEYNRDQSLLYEKKFMVRRFKLSCFMCGNSSIGLISLVANNQKMIKVTLYGYILTSIVKRLIKQDSVDITFDEALNIAKEYNDSLKGQTKIAI